MESDAGHLTDRQLVETIASAWRLATSDIAYIPLSGVEIRERFQQLVAGALTAIQSPAPRMMTLEQGRTIGRALVELNLSKSEALERTLACLSAELAGLGEPRQVGWLLAGIAGGFTAAAAGSILKQQENIGRAANKALQRAQSDLETSRDRLSEANRQLSAEIEERIHAEQMQRRLAERLRRLHELDLAVLSAQSLSDIVNISLEYIQQVIPAINVSISILDLVNKRLMVLSSTNAAYPVGRNISITMLQALERLKAGEAIYIRDLKELRDQSVATAEIVDLGGRSSLATPIHFGGEIIGVLSIIVGEVREFSDEEIEIAREIADSVSVAIQNRQLLEAEQSAREREAILREVAASLTLGLSLDDLLQSILDQLDRVMTNHSSAILLIQNDMPVVVAHRGSPSLPARLNELVLTRPLSIWSVLKTGRLKVINDTHGSPEWTIIEGFEYIRAWMGVPLMVKGECIGIMTIDRATPDAFTAQDQDLALAFANQAAIAIDNVGMFNQLQEHAGQLEEHVHRRTRELQLLYGITATAVGNPEMDSMLRRSLQLMADAFGCPAAAVFLPDGETDQLRPAALLEGAGPELNRFLEELTPEHLLLAHPLHHENPAIVRGDKLAIGWDQEVELIAVAVPLRSRGRNLGVLCLLWDDPRQYDAVSQTLLETIADQLGAAVENIRFHHIVRQAAIIEERERLAGDIHDQVTQSIYSAGLFAEAARDAAAVGNLTKVEHHTHSILRMTNQALRELRLLLSELRIEALARHGLADALRERLKTVEHRAYIDGEVHAAELGEIPVAVEETFYRIALEALNNALRHARAERVDITLSVEDGELVMMIADNGIGFDREEAAAAGGMGLASMQKRIGKVNGVLTLNSNENGSQVVARAPLEA